MAFVALQIDGEFDGKIDCAHAISRPTYPRMSASAPPPPSTTNERISTFLAWKKERKKESKKQRITTLLAWRKERKQGTENKNITCMEERTEARKRE
jgi:hypothetical protein